MSRNSSTHFPPNTEDIKDTPVMFPPGRAKLGTMPVSTGSAAIITIGISWVACFAASAQGTYSATITSNLKPDKLGRELRKSIQLSFRGAKLECDVLPLYVAEFTQSFPELVLERLRVSGSYVECAYSRHLGLLPARREGPRDGRAAE